LSGGVGVGGDRASQRGETAQQRGGEQMRIGGDKTVLGHGLTQELLGAAQPPPLVEFDPRHAEDRGAVGEQDSSDVTISVVPQEYQPRLLEALQRRSLRRHGCGYLRGERRWGIVDTTAASGSCLVGQ